MLLNNEWVHQKIKEKIDKILGGKCKQINNNNKQQQQQQQQSNGPKPLNAAKAVLTGRFIVIQTYIKKEEKSQISNLTLHLKDLEKEQRKLQTSRRNNKD